VVGDHPFYSNGFASSSGALSDRRSRPSLTSCGWTGRRSSAGCPVHAEQCGGRTPRPSDGIDEMSVGRGTATASSSAIDSPARDLFGGTGRTRRIWICSSSGSETQMPGIRLAVMDMVEAVSAGDAQGRQRRAGGHPLRKFHILRHWEKPLMRPQVRIPPPERSRPEVHQGQKYHPAEPREN